MPVSHYLKNLNGPSLADRLTATGNRPSGFDYLRIILALTVILWHSELICYGDRYLSQPWHRLLDPFAFLIVPMFFALSGFLVAGSLERSKTLVTFLGLRIFRIMPALAVEVLLSALILGPLLTTLPLAEYFTHPEFYAYFMNILGEIHYTLPGLFEAPNPNHQVNGQLWTVPYELVCYVVLALFAVLGIFRRREWLLVSLGLYYAGQVINTIVRTRYEVSGPTGSTVVMAFIAGLVIYQYRDRLPWSKGWFLALAALSLLILSVPNGSRFIALPAAYLTAYLGLLNPPRNRLALSGDYSYGLYLYGFPLQQALFAWHPFFREWWGNLLGAVPAAIAIAVFSWWVIEKPALGQRHHLKHLEEWYLKQRARFHPRRQTVSL